MPLVQGQAKSSVPASKPPPAAGRLGVFFSLFFIFILAGCLPRPSVLPTEQRTSLPQPTANPFLTLAPTPLPTAAPTLPPAGCSQTSGSIEQRQVASALVGKPIDLRIYLPPCYPGPAGMHYPVLYLLHGQSSTDDQWQRLGALHAADALITSGDLPPFIIVMPREEYYLADSKESPYGRALAEEIVPWVDRTYPTCPQRACRAIGGLSRGAAWAVRMGFMRWDLFSAVGGHSLPPFLGDPNRFPGWLEEISSGRRPRLWLDTGDNDTYLASTLQFVEVLKKTGLPHEWHLYPGIHNEEYWGSHVEQYLSWYAAAWPPSNP